MFQEALSTEYWKLTNKTADCSIPIAYNELYTLISQFVVSYAS